MKRALIALGLLAAVTGCASGYSQFFRPVAEPPEIVQAFAGEPTIVTSSGNPVRDVDTMFEQGLVAVGQSAFQGRNEGLGGAIAQAKKIGASHVVVSANYSHTVSGAIPITTMQTRYAQSNGTVTAIGTGGSATATYNGTTTYQTPQTTMIPYAVDRYDQRAIYFAPMRRHGMGVRAFPPTSEEASRLGTNHGFLVHAVRRGSPAFKADILPGDLILRVNGQPVDTNEEMAALLTPGGQFKLTLRRNGAEAFVAVYMAPGLDW